jgi:hypothetical protein
LCDDLDGQIRALPLAKSASGAASLYFAEAVGIDLQCLLSARLDADEASLAPCDIPSDAGIVNEFRAGCNHYPFPFLDVELLRFVDFSTGLNSTTKCFLSLLKVLVEL